MTPGTSPEPAGLYIHVPFCSAICPYCDFAVTTGDETEKKRFVADLVQEITLCSGCESTFDTIYLGGGTPSVLPPGDIGDILDTAKATLDMSPDTTIHMECNPEDVTPDALQDWDDLGVSFLSLGVQSFDAGELKFLGRRHSAADSRRSVEDAMASGIRTVSLDLIFGLPEQDMATWTRSLEIASSSSAHHVSCYQLTVHEGTPFHRRVRQGVLQEMPEPLQGGFFHETHRILSNAGLVAYEVSNFSRGTSHQSYHNSKYWRHAPYLGIGPSAHSFDGSRRSWNHRALDDWSGAIRQGHKPEADGETLNDRQLALEKVMLRMRTCAGLDLAEFRTLFGIDLLEANRRTVQQWVSEGLVSLVDDRVVPSAKGLAVADGLAAALRF